jgi:hypothetical protein
MHAEHPGCDANEVEIVFDCHAQQKLLSKVAPTQV